jgi:hypothetical protein
MSVTGEPGRPPVKSGGPVCDINAGLLAALGVVSAYVHRLKTGEGQLVDTSLFEAGVQQMYWQAAIFFATGEVPGPTGSAHILSAPYQAFRAADGWLTIGGANQGNWERLVRVLKAEPWLADARFLEQRGAHEACRRAQRRDGREDSCVAGQRPARGARCRRRALRQDQFHRRRGRRSRMRSPAKWSSSCSTRAPGVRARLDCRSSCRALRGRFPARPLF